MSPNRPPVRSLACWKSSAGGPGFTAVHSLIDGTALKHYDLRVISKVEECGSDFYAITAERRVKHPAAMAITEHAYSTLFAESTG